MFVKILNNTLKSIADAVRSKIGETGTMLPSEIPDKIKGISSGGVDLSTIADGTYKWGDYIATEKEIKTPVYSFQNMTSYTNPNLTSITANNAFSQSKLTTFSAPSLLIIGGSNTFNSCEKLERVELPVLPNLDGYVFSYCHGLKLVDIGEACKTIHKNAFSNSDCQLELIVRASVPPALSGEFSLGKDGAITSIKVPAESVDEYKAAINWKAYSDIISAI